MTKIISGCGVVPGAVLLSMVQYMRLANDVVASKEYDARCYIY